MWRSRNFFFCLGLMGVGFMALVPTHAFAEDSVEHRTSEDRFSYKVKKDIQSYRKRNTQIQTLIQAFLASELPRRRQLALDFKSVPAEIENDLKQVETAVALGQSLQSQSGKLTLVAQLLSQAETNLRSAKTDNPKSDKDKKSDKKSTDKEESKDKNKDKETKSSKNVASPEKSNTSTESSENKRSSGSDSKSEIKSQEAKSSNGTLNNPNGNGLSDSNSKNGIFKDSGTRMGDSLDAAPKDLKMSLGDDISSWNASDNATQTEVSVDNGGISDAASSGGNGKNNTTAASNGQGGNANSVSDAGSGFGVGNSTSIGGGASVGGAGGGTVAPPFSVVIPTIPAANAQIDASPQCLDFDKDADYFLKSDGTSYVDRQKLPNANTRNQCLRLPIGQTCKDEDRDGKDDRFKFDCVAGNPIRVYCKDSNKDNLFDTFPSIQCVDGQELTGNIGVKNTFNGIFSLINVY